MKVVPIRRAIILNAHRKFKENRVFVKEEMGFHGITPGFDEIHLMDTFPEIAPENTVLADNEGEFWQFRRGRWQQIYKASNF